MIQITTLHHLHLWIEPIDFRKGLDALIGLFRNTSGIAVKLLVYDGTDFWLCTKRFSQGKLNYWPKSLDEPICATTMAIILNQGNPVEMRPSWRPLPSSA